MCGPENPGPDPPAQAARSCRELARVSENKVQQTGDHLRPGRQWRHTHVRPGAAPPPAKAEEGGCVVRAALGVFDSR